MREVLIDLDSSLAIYLISTNHIPILFPLLKILRVWIEERREPALALSAYPLGGAAAALGAWARWAFSPH